MQLTGTLCSLCRIVTVCILIHFARPFHVSSKWVVAGTLSHIMGLSANECTWCAAIWWYIVQRGDGLAHYLCNSDCLNCCYYKSGCDNAKHTQWQHLLSTISVYCFFKVGCGWEYYPIPHMGFSENECTWCAVIWWYIVGTGAGLALGLCSSYCLNCWLW